ncbi:agamous-like MADS-box protein AGL80 [Telopea speciosissima]|uniref:agamous-like MADS-box protein AGL80 n=1 Tax=Telopea speciosissima TaxID=54955 RepID=UPI001CC67EBB|nr:agamous-like MADS-box protein AGL80 [Telopea speciosissima]
MTRKKVKLALIPDEAARRRTFYRRKDGIMKKLSELSTLCGVLTCAIIYSPFEQQPFVWPSPAAAERVLDKFKSMSVFEQGKNMLSQVEYLQQRITKLKDQLRKIQLENRKKEMTMLMYQCLKGKDLNDLTMLELTDLTKVVAEKMEAIEKRIETLKQTQSEIGTSGRIAGGASSADDSTDLQVAVDTLINTDNSAWTVPFCP